MSILILFISFFMCFSNIEGKINIRAKPRIRSRSAQINRMKRLLRLHESCKEHNGNGTTLNDYYCRMCGERMEYCDYSYLPAITRDYCTELATNITHAKIPYYCTVCLANKYTCISPKSLDFKRFETIKTFNNCSSYPMDAEECIQYCKVDKLLPKSEISDCSNSSTTFEVIVIAINLMIAYAVYKGIQIMCHIVS
jgi:hypothetical protein